MVANCAAYGADGRKVRDITLDEISDFLQQPHGFVWVGLVEPDEALLEKLQAEFGLHELAVEDAHTAHQRPKIEAYGDSLFIVAQTAQMTEGNIAFGETHIFIGKQYLLSVRHGASRSYAPARRTCEQAPEHLALGPSYALYSILDYIVDNYLPIVQDFKEELQDLEHDVFSDAANRDVTRRLYDMQRELLTLKLAATPLQDILGQLVRLHPELIRDEVRPYFRDVQDHLLRVVGRIEGFRDLLTSVLAANLTQVSVRQNDDARTITAWVAIGAVPTIIGAIYGMNFEHMPELRWTFGYPLALGVMAIICLFLYWRFRKAGWL